MIEWLEAQVSFLSKWNATHFRVEWMEEGGKGESVVFTVVEMKHNALKSSPVA